MIMDLGKLPPQRQRPQKILLFRQLLQIWVFYLADQLDECRGHATVNEASV